jgi:NAD(P)-dependent dehydrogenase (short-subunit alcohol dehydrogenase family)
VIEMTTWQGRVCIVTGAGAGIGKGIADVFAEAGCEVVVGDVNRERGEEVAQQLQQRYGRGVFIHTDVSKDEDCQLLVNETYRKYGRIDTLVNNAGVNFVVPTLDMTIEDWDRVVNVDLRGTFLCSRYALEHMVKAGSGSIINIASVHTKATLGGAAPYAASKGGVAQMTASMAIEFAPYGIRINALSPGLIDTLIWQQLQDVAVDKQAVVQHWMDNIPLARVGTPREMGQVALYLASDEASYIIGANILADGGMTSLLINRERYENRPVEGKYQD